MEPVSSGTIALTLLKLGAGTLTGPLASLLKKKSLRRRVARRSSKAARSHGIRIRRKDLRRWLADAYVQEQLAHGRTSDVDWCVTQLAELCVNSRGDTESAARRVLELVLDEYLRAQNVSDANVASTRWIQDQVAEEAETTRTTILDALAVPALFTEDLKGLHPWRRQPAIELRARWSPIVDLVHSIVTHSDRGEVLRNWADSPPIQTNDAPAEAWCWLGLVAADYQQQSAAATFFRQGIKSGATPANYWWARIAIGTTDDVERHGALAEMSDPPHPLVVAQNALMDSRYADAEEALTDWQENGPNDRSIKAIFLSASAFGRGDINRAIAIEIESSLRDPEGSGLQLRTAEALLWRGHHGTSDHSLNDYIAARSMAVKARDSRREWLGDSVAAILVAVKAAALGSDVDRAWRLTLPAPDGAATDEESNDPRLRNESAILAATIGNFEYAQSVAKDVGDPFTIETVDGWVHFGRGQSAEATESWMRAWESAPDDLSKIQIAAALAPVGGHMPDLAELEVEHPESLKRLRAIHTAMSAGDDKTALLRARAPESVQMTVLLAQQLETDDAHLEAASILEDGANRWNHPLLMRMAADIYLRAGEYELAARSAESALALGGNNWAGALDAMGIRFDALEAAGRLTESVQVARQMAALEPSNLHVRWTLVHCLVRRGNTESAWTALTPHGDPVPSRGIQDARAWIFLMAQFDTSPMFVNRALAEMRRWHADPDLSGAYLAQIYAGLTRHKHEIQTADLAALHTATEKYADSYPESRTFRMAKVGPDHNPLAAFEDSLRREAESQPLNELRAKVARGELPLGLLASTSGRSYTELSIRRAAGRVFSHDLDSRAPASSIDPSLGHAVAIDVTAATTLALLEPTVIDLLIGMFRSIQTTDLAFHDCLNAQQNLQLRNTLSVAWSPEHQQPIPVEISDEEADAMARHAATITHILTRANRRGWPMLQHFNALDSGSPWLSAIDFAVSSQLPFWCDDRVLRSLARQNGIPSFGTIDLMRRLATRQEFDVQLRQVAEGVLLHNYHVDIGFDSEVFRLGAQLAGWMPSGAASALTRPSSWFAPEKTIDFVYQALGQVAGQYPDALRGWVECAATGLLNISPDDSESAMQNLQLFMSQMMGQQWMLPGALPFAVSGIRNALAERPGVEDPLLRVLQAMYDSLSDRHSSAAAAELLLIWVQHLSTEDRATTARVILTSDH